MNGRTGSSVASSRSGWVFLGNLELLSLNFRGDCLAKEATWTPKRIFLMNLMSTVDRFINISFKRGTSILKRSKKFLTGTQLWISMGISCTSSTPVNYPVTTRLSLSVATQEKKKFIRTFLQVDCSTWNGIEPDYVEKYILYTYQGRSTPCQHTVPPHLTKLTSPEIDIRLYQRAIGALMYLMHCLHHDSARPTCLPRERAPAGTRPRVPIPPRLVRATGDGNMCSSGAPLTALS
ncbi:hypothetical protein EDB89DRAFT_974677 [Lactarius sanguifluus]|nr:hypothetical protein EDB89DRAFT_974677 [Lactarius sanguifluus]